MRVAFTNIIETSTIFLFLLPVFFVLHGYAENYNLVTVKEAIIIASFYIGVAIMTSFLTWLFYRNYSKSCLFGFCILAVQFFFGSVQDFLRYAFPNTFIVKYVFLLPSIFGLLIIVAFLLKKSETLYKKVICFLNLLLIILISIELISLIIKKSNLNEKNRQIISENLVSCDSCTRPDIYLIVLDEYAGKEELKDIFSFKNDSFETDLSERGFHIIEGSKSNYNWTIYSIASCLNMNFIKDLRSNKENIYDNHYCANLIKNNVFSGFLQLQGYKIYNYSCFDIGNHPRINNPNIIPTGEKLILAQTLTSRIKKELGSRITAKSEIMKILTHHLSCNNKADSLTRIIAAQKKENPKFVYSHFMMPHPPYFFDSKGKMADYKTLLNDDYYKSEKNAYIEYLQYTNKYILDLIDNIRNDSEKEPVIILMSDHGFRQFEAGEKVDPKYYFMTLNAIYLPSGNYSGFYNGMTNVNQFRIILNTEFGQKLPLLKDSVSFIWDH